MTITELSSLRSACARMRTIVFILTLLCFHQRFLISIVIPWLTAFLPPAVAPSDPNWSMNVVDQRNKDEQQSWKDCLVTALEARDHLCSHLIIHLSRD